MNTLRFFLTALVALCLAVPVRAEFDDVVQAEVRPGWRLNGGDHMAALHLTLAPGWKTYWRAPGDAGIPPVFDWSASRNVARVGVVFPTPDVFFQAGMRSVGYSQEVVLPLRVSTQNGRRAAQLTGEVELGICRDICIPYTIAFDVALPAAGQKPDPMIAAALADVPYSAREASVGEVRCSVAPTSSGLQLRAEVDMPPMAEAEEVVIEAGNPLVWVADPATERQGGTLVAITQMMHVSQKAFALDRSAVRITVLGGGAAVDIRGCG